MKLLFSPNHQITLINCEIVDDTIGFSVGSFPLKTRRTVVAKLSRFDANLQPGIYQLKENAVTCVCQIRLPEWAISNETLIFLEPITLEVKSQKSEVRSTDDLNF